MYSVCSVRLRPVRAEGLNFASREEAVTNPLVVAQIQPWKKTGRTSAYYGGGPNPRWIGGKKKIDEKKFIIDLPYYGHPYSGKIPSVLLMVLNVPEEESEAYDVDERGSVTGLSPELVGRASFDLRPYLYENKNTMHGITLSLKDNKDNYVGKIVCTLQFVLTGIMRMTVLSGERLRSNISENENIEPYVKAKLVPGKNKWRATIHRHGEDPEWGVYNRKATLANFSFTKFNIFGSEKDEKQSQSGSLLTRKHASNVLNFRFKDDDRSVVPVIHVEVFDKWDTTAKREQRVEAEKTRMEKLETQIRVLRRRSKGRAGLTTSLSATFDGSPKVMSKSIVGKFFQKTVKRKKDSNATRFEEVNIASDIKPSSSNRDSNIQKPLSEEEAELVSRLKKASLRLKAINEGTLNNNMDKLIGKGSVDLRPFLKYDGKRQEIACTIDLSDENGLASGQINCNVEFENSAYDPTQEVLKVPEFSLDLSKISYKESITYINGLKMKDFIEYSRNIYVLVDVMLDLYAPSFVIKTSNQSKVPKVVVFTLFFSIAFLFMLSLWKGLGNEFISYIVGVLYPTFQSYKALESKKTDLNNQWLTYWIIYGMFNFLEKTVLLPIIFVYPTLFFISKTLLFLWLTNPQTLGATIIYHMVIAPLMRLYQDDIDQYISVFGQTTQNLAKDFAGMYDQFEQEMSYAVSHNIVDKTGYFANENFHSKTNRKRLSKTVKELFDDSATSAIATVIRVPVSLSGKKKSKMIQIDLEDKVEDVLLQACGILGIDNFNDYSLYFFYKGKPVLLDDTQQLEVLKRPRLLVKIKGDEESDI